MKNIFIFLTAIILCTGCNKGTGNITQNEVDGTVSAPGLSAPADDTASLQMPEVETKPSLPEKDFVYTESGSIYTEDGSFYPDVINGIWENRKEGVRFPFKSNFSWGENVDSLSSVAIDLNWKKNYGPFISINYGAIFIIQEIESQGTQVILTGNRMGRSGKMTITIIDENTISIDADEDLRFRSESFRFEDDDNPNNYYYRVPFDAPYEPYPGEDHP